MARQAGTRAGPSERVKLFLRLALAGIGLGFFAWFVQRAGVGEIARAFRELGAPALIALLPYGLVYLLDTVGWRWSFGHDAPLPFLTLLRVRWAGESVNNIIPTGYVGGEAVKVFLLQKYGVAASSGTVSVIIGKTCQSLAQVIFIALGALAAWSCLPSGSAAAGAMFAVSGLSFTMLAAALWLQGRGLFHTLLPIARRFRLTVSTARETALRGLDDRMGAFYRRDRRSFLRSTTAYLAGWLCDPLEILLISHLLGVPISYPKALAIEAFISVAKAAGSFVPGAIGVQETGIVFLGHLFGLPPSLAITYAIFRRGRELLYAAAGGALWMAEAGHSSRVALPARIAP